MNPLFALGAMLLAGSPALLPIGLLVWIYGKAGARTRNRLVVSAVPALAASVGAVWAFIEFNDRDAWINVPVYVGASVLGGAAAGVFAARFWRPGNWLIQTIVVMMVALFLVVSGFMNFIVILFLGGVQ